MKKKKIVIFGPIGDFGGREVEVNIIVKALEKKYNVVILTTSYFTKNSFALKDSINTSWNCIPKTIYKKNILIKLFAKVSKLKSKKKHLDYFYFNNFFFKKLFNSNKLQLQIVENEIKDAHLVLSCVQLTSKFLPEVIRFCKEQEIPCLIRTTGFIKKIDIDYYNFLKKATLFIHHSESNANNLNQQLKLQYIIIDQCANNEKALLKIDIKKRKAKVFMTSCRLEKEKNVDILISAFLKTKNEDDFLYIIGDGNYKNELISISQNNSNVKFVGLVNNSDLDYYYNLSDCFVITYYEDETGPLTGVEAMSAGKIIISPKTGAMPQRLKHLKNQFWFDNNIESLQNEILKVKQLNENDLFEIATENRLEYLKKYQEKIIQEQYESVIEQFVK